ncbi:hypothetical protein AB0N14_19900 [Streptomyces sp. NPDC051104]|uniref:hypothetical protein n=1 Tax=Streptomyces sp. NPDC051104 TaxID=3155044 RepID=UPI0034272A58
MTPLQFLADISGHHPDPTVAEISGVGGLGGQPRPSARESAISITIRDGFGAGTLP